MGLLEATPTIIRTAAWSVRVVSSIDVIKLKPWILRCYVDVWPTDTEQAGQYG
jgi:hypothetical protein